MTLVSTAEPVRDPGRLDRILMRAASGQMVRVRGFVRIEDRAAAPEPGREGQRLAVASTAGLTPALALGPALAEVDRVAPDVPGPGMRIPPLVEAATLV